MYAYLTVTSHLHFWQNDGDLLRATAVTRGWNRHRNDPESAQEVVPGEENSPSAPARTRTLDLSSPAVYPLSYPCFHSPGVRMSVVYFWCFSLLRDFMVDTRGTTGNNEVKNGINKVASLGPVFL